MSGAASGLLGAVVFYAVVFLVMRAFGDPAKRSLTNNEFGCGLIVLSAAGVLGAWLLDHVMIVVR